MPDLLARRGALPALTLVLMLAGATATATPSAPETPDRVAAPCAAPASTVDEAATLARDCENEIEVLAERTSWDSVYAQPDGTMRLVTSTAAVRTLQDGEWVPVDNTVVAGDGDGLTIAAAVVPMTFSDGTDDDVPLVTLERDGHTLDFDVPFDLPEPVVDDGQLVYEDVIPDVDLILTVSPDTTSFTETLRVETPAAAQDPRLAELRFPVTTSDDLEVSAAGGGFVAKDTTGETIFLSPAPMMWDSSRTSVLGPAPVLRAGRLQQMLDEQAAEDAAELAGLNTDPAIAPVGGERVAEVPATFDGEALSLVPDDAMLTDPATVWPVYIDPPVTGSRQHVAAVRSDGFGRKTGWNNEGVGRCNVAAYCLDGFFTSRLLWRFTGLEQIRDASSTDIIGATFSAYGTHSYDCTDRNVSLYRTADFDPSTVDWGVSFFLPVLATRTVAHKLTGCATRPQAWVEFNATEAVKIVADANTTALALGLVANDESNMSSWKRYRYDATLSISYNRAPSTPTSLRTDRPSTTCTSGSGRPWINSVNPTLVATLSDPDGGTVKAGFEVLNLTTGGNRVWGPVETAHQGSGTAHAATVTSGLQNGSAYRWRVTPTDGEGRAGGYAECEFSVDTSPPVPPTIATVPDQPAVYLRGTPAGGLGETGKFTFSPGSSTDVVAFSYSVDGQAPTRVDVSPGSSATVSYTPTTSAGLKELTVSAIDRANNVSGTSAHPFIVKFPGVWRLDEGNGTSAAGQGTSGRRFPLEVSPSTTWVDGLLTAAQFSTGDKALRFDQSSDVAKTAGQVVPTNVPFSVMAFVTTDITSRSATAVSQDGSQVSQFELGIVQASDCPTGTGVCWGFSMRATDSTSATTTRALSSVPVTPGDWYHVVGISGSQNIRLSVCRLGPVGALEPNPTPVLTDPVSVPPSWNAVGQMKVGQAMSAATPTRTWIGTVDNVSVMDGPASIAKLRTSCAQVE